MPIHADTNLYPGINPHLNSQLQQPGGGWQSFHAAHIAHITEALDTLLPDVYYVASENSLQIGTYDREAPLAPPRTTRPDVTVFARESRSGEVVASPSSATLTLPLADTLPDDEEDIRAVVVYRMTGGYPGQPVTRIELLSPANKFPGSHHESYLQKRRETLFAGLHLVELDYLHERRPLLPQLPAYNAAEASAFPYHILLSNPHPTPHEGIVSVFSFGVLQTMPTVNIPLQADDTVMVDFGALYNHTLASSRLFRRVLVDYAQEPVNIAAYTPADREKIRNRMAEIAATDR